MDVNLSKKHKGSIVAWSKFQGEEGLYCITLELTNMDKVNYMMAFRCSCPSFMFTHKECKHIKEFKKQLNLGDLAWAII